MTETKKSDDGRGIPPQAVGTTAEPQVSDRRLIPGGSFGAARKQIGMTGMDHYIDRPGPKADLPDLSETPGWHMVPKTDRR